MPKYIDHHVMPPMSAKQMNALLDQLRADVKANKADKFGVTYINTYMAPGEAFGLSDAPNAEAVVKSHEAMGIKLKASDVVEVTPLV